MTRGVNQSLDIARYKKYTIDLKSKFTGKNDETQSGSGDNLRRSTKIERTTVRNLAAARRRDVFDTKQRNSDYDSIAGKPTANFGKPFSYIESCVPGARKLDSNR